MGRVWLECELGSNAREIREMTLEKMTCEKVPEHWKGGRHLKNIQTKGAKSGAP